MLDEWKKAKNGSRNALARKYDVATQTIRGWGKIQELHGDSALVPRDGKRNKYTGDFRIKVAEELINSGLSKHEICSKYNFKESLVLRWKKLYIENGKEFLAIYYRGRKKGEPIKNIISTCKKLRLNDLQTKTEKALYNENERLRAELDYTKKLNVLIQSRQVSKKR
ncbi:transposase [Clostridium psychrophilum]|nr:transposase [Clostridium psychrophilum]